MSCGNSKSFVLLPPTRVNESGQLDLILSFDALGFKEVNLSLVILAVSGTSPTLNATVLTADVNDTAYFANATAFAQASAVGVDIEYNTSFGRYLSVKWVIGGSDTPTFVFTVVGTAKV